MMKISDKGLQALRFDEGERLTAYKDSAGIWTIGVGHTGKVDGKPVQRGMTITAAQSMALLRADVGIAENGVNYHIKKPMTQNQFDAFVNLTFNIGVAAFANSTTAREFNKGNVKKASEAILWWNKVTDPRSKRKIEIDGLTQRRIRTKRMFDSAEYKGA